MVDKYVSWDPGEVRTGRTRWDENATMIMMEDLTEEQFDTALESTPDTVKFFIIEKYIPYGGFNHTGNKLLTAQRIGDIKGYARRHGIRVVEIPANNKFVAAKWARYDVSAYKGGGRGKKNHMPDWLASYLVGYWWLYKEGYIKSKLLER